MTLACEDANSKLVVVVNIASEVVIKLNFCQDFEVEVQDVEAGVCSAFCR